MYWIENFDKWKSFLGREYYWFIGEFVNEDKGEDIDEWVLKNGYILVVFV